MIMSKLTLKYLSKYELNEMVLCSVAEPIDDSIHSLHSQSRSISNIERLAWYSFLGVKYYQSYVV